MVGTETLPITLGERRTLILLRIILLFTAAILVVGAASGAADRFCYLMLIPISTLWLSLLAYERKWISPGTALEALVETNFLLSGFLAMIWQGWSWRL